MGTAPTCRTCLRARRTATQVWADPALLCCPFYASSECLGVGSHPKLRVAPFSSLHDGANVAALQAACGMSAAGPAAVVPAGFLTAVWYPKNVPASLRKRLLQGLAELVQVRSLPCLV